MLLACAHLLALTLPAAEAYLRAASPGVSLASMNHRVDTWVDDPHYLVPTPRGDETTIEVPRAVVDALGVVVAQVNDLLEILDVPNLYACIQSGGHQDVPASGVEVQRPDPVSVTLRRALTALETVTESSLRDS